MGKYFALIIAVAAVVLAGCTTTAVKTSTSSQLTWRPTERRVVLVEPDIQLGEMGASGIVTPRADWTKSAKQNIAQAMQTYFATHGVQFVVADPLTDAHDIQIAKLNGAVGNAVLLHLYMPGYKLPNKGDALDWTLGEGAQSIRDHYNADYAVFLYVRDSYTSAGRALVMLGAAVLGVGLTGGQQVAFASVVDLKTGNIVWFNRLVSASGDLRTLPPTTSFVEAMFGKLPL